jgi:hypothetical protein
MRFLFISDLYCFRGSVGEDAEDLSLPDEEDVDLKGLREREASSVGEVFLVGDLLDPASGFIMISEGAPCLLIASRLD